MHAHHIDDIAEIVAVFSHSAGGAQLVTAHHQLAGGRTHRRQRRQRKAGRAAVAVVDAHRVAGVDGHARVRHAAVVQTHHRRTVVVLHAGDGVRRRSAISAARGGHPHQQLVGRHDGEITRLVAEAVVVGTAPRGLQHAVVCTGNRVAAVPRSGGCHIAAGGGDCFTVHKTAHAHRETRIALGHEPGVVVGTRRQRGPGDAVAGVGVRGQAVVAGLCSCEGQSGESNCCRGRHVFAVEGAHGGASEAHHITRVGLAVGAGTRARCNGRLQCRRAAYCGGGRAVIDLVGTGQSTDGERLGIDRHRIAGTTYCHIRQLVIAGQAARAAGCSSCVTQRDGADEIAGVVGHVFAVGGRAGVGQGFGHSTHRHPGGDGHRPGEVHTAVISLACRQAHCFGRDIGRSSDSAKRVVVFVGTIKAQTSDGDGLTIGHVLVSKGADSGASKGNGIAAQVKTIAAGRAAASQGGRTANRGTLIAVVHLVAGAQAAGRQCLGVHRQGAGAGAPHVVSPVRQTSADGVGRAAGLEPVGGGIGRARNRVTGTVAIDCAGRGDGRQRIAVGHGQRHVGDVGRGLFAVDGVGSGTQSGGVARGGLVTAVAKIAAARTHQRGDACAPGYAAGVERDALAGFIGVGVGREGDTGSQLNVSARTGSRAGDVRIPVGIEHNGAGGAVGGADVVGNCQTTGERCNTHRSGGRDAAGGPYRANGQGVAVHIRQAAHATGGQSTNRVAGGIERDIAAQQRQLVGRDKAAGAVSDRAAALEADGVGTGGGQTSVDRDIAAIDCDRTSHNGSAADRDVGRVALLANGQSR